MTSNSHQVNYDLIPEGLEASIIKVEISSYTQSAQFLISIPAINFEYWSHESNMVSWHDYKDFTQREKDILKAGKERAQQIRNYYDGKLSIKILDTENPLKQFTELQK